MKPYLFPIRLYAEDHKRRLYLEKTMRDESGRKMTFASIIRKLLLEAETLFQTVEYNKRKKMGNIEDDPIYNLLKF